MRKFLVLIAVIACAFGIYRVVMPPSDAPSTTVFRTTGHGRIWITDAANESRRVRPLEVLLGVTDGVMTEIGGDGVAEGLLVVVGEDETGAVSVEIAAEEGETTNPFLPKLPKRTRPRGPM